MVNTPIFCIAENLHVADYLMVSETIHRKEVGRRLRAAIEAKGLTQAAVVTELGASASKLGNWLRGDNYPSAWFVARFCERYGVTTDWIYRGVVSGMDAALGGRLWKSEQAAAEPQAVPPSSRRNLPDPSPAQRVRGLGSGRRGT